MELSQKQRWREEMRLIISISLSSFAAATVWLIPGELFGSSIVSVYVRASIIASGLSALAYILFTGTHLKYQDKGFLGQFPIAPRLRKWSFDLAIDVFGIYSMLLVFAAVEGTMKKFFPNFEHLSSVSLVISSIAILLLIFASLIFSHKSKDSVDAY